MSSADQETPAVPQIIPQKRTLELSPSPEPGPEADELEDGEIEEVDFVLEPGEVTLELSPSPPPADIESNRDDDHGSDLIMNSDDWRNHDSLQQAPSLAAALPPKPIAASGSGSTRGGKSNRGGGGPARGAVGTAKRGGARAPTSITPGERNKQPGEQAPAASTSAASKKAKKQKQAPPQQQKQQKPVKIAPVLPTLDPPYYTTPYLKATYPEFFSFPQNGAPKDAIARVIHTVKELYPQAITTPQLSSLQGVAVGDLTGLGGPPGMGASPAFPSQTGLHGEIYRAQVLISNDPPILGHGDAPSKKEAEAIACLHALAQLYQHKMLKITGKSKLRFEHTARAVASAIPADRLGPPASMLTSGAASSKNAKSLSSTGTVDERSQVGPAAANVFRLSDGTLLTTARAREFIDFYCNEYKFGKPDYKFPAENLGGSKHKGKGKKGKAVSSAWECTMVIAGSEIGKGSAKTKKEAQDIAMLDAVHLIESHDPGLWRQFDVSFRPGAPLANAPKMYFDLVEDIDEDICRLITEIRTTQLYARRPKDVAGMMMAGEGSSSKGAHRIKGVAMQNGNGGQAGGSSTPGNDGHDAPRARARQIPRPSDSFLQEKSDRLLRDLQNYQFDSRHEAMRSQRLSLPVTKQANDVLVKVELNQVTICMAATGSGKTTQVPQILFDDHIMRGEGAKCNIVCTQPRRIAAISVAQRVARERGEPVGQTVGYQVRFENREAQPNGSINFCTTGVFLRRLQSSLGDGAEDHTWLDTITHVVVDEVHERDVETDLLLVVIRRVLADRKRMGKSEIKLVLMSATIDPKLFQSYFSEQQPIGPGGSMMPKLAPVVEIPGRSYPVEKHFLDDIIPRLETLRLPPEMGGWIWREKNVCDYLDRELLNQGGMRGQKQDARQPYVDEDDGDDEGSDSIDVLELPYPLICLMIADILARSKDGHVLVFLPGWDEIKAVNTILMNTGSQPLLRLPFDDPNRFEVHILHSSVSLAEQQAVFEPPRSPTIRRIILATNIAETSVTIPDVVYVVDTGRVKEKRYDPQRHLSSLVSAWVGTSNLNQRAGRAGRHRAGEYYGVLGKARYGQLRVNQTVEMKRLDLSNVVMHVKALSIPGMEVEDVLASAIEPPAPERVAAAIDRLKMVGALDAKGKLTSLGLVLLQLPVDTFMGKFCLYGAFFRCLDPALSLAAILTNRDPFVAPVQMREQANAIKAKWCPRGFRSDALTALRAYYDWWSLQGRGNFVEANRFCYDNFLSKPTLLQVQQVKEHLFQSMEKAGVIRAVLGESEVGQAQNSYGGYESRGGYGTQYGARKFEANSPELNENSDKPPLLAALIAMSNAPNFAIRTGGKSNYRTSQDKSCFVHLSSLCHKKFTKEDPDLEKGETELLAFGEKTQNASGVTSTNKNQPQTTLRMCTRIDPLSYLLFGSYDIRVGNKGLFCDGWLPVVGNIEALDDVERLKSVLNVCMLRVFQGIGKRPLSESRPQQNWNTKATGSRRNSDGEEEMGEWMDDEGNGPSSINPRDLSISPQETAELKGMTTGIAQILLAYYYHHQSGQNGSRGPSRPDTPNGIGPSGSQDHHLSSYHSAPGSVVSGHAPSGRMDPRGFSTMPSSAYNSRPETPQSGPPYRAGGGGYSASGPGGNAGPYSGGGASHNASWGGYGGATSAKDSYGSWR
ncbi:hypothetical protein OC846_004607 [Tilletia horrida]|uniref:RNA helicase n=1 Tax=Tilletia horrida TaxID=155126 RepID=A0AAN6GS83_9BASI|nr:hypothetical protein OC846_004607 [Tilletia horrida]